MSSKRASVNPLALFLKPQSPAERLAAQQRDREKLQRKRQLKELQEEEAKARGEAGKRPVVRTRGSPHLRLPLCVAIAACKPLTLFPCFGALCSISISHSFSRSLSHSFNLFY
jgi:hypothetical protein